jgi:hypothetical protein
MELHISGYSPRDLIPGMSLQDNILAGRLHGFLSEFVVTNVPEPGGIGPVLLGAASLGLAVLRRGRAKLV